MCRKARQITGMLSRQVVGYTCVSRDSFGSRGSLLCFAVFWRLG